MIIQLWGSWLVLFIIARLLGGLVMILAMFIMAFLPGDRNLRFTKLIANNGRGMYSLIGVVLLIALIGVYFVSQWWFAFIEFTPVGVAVFGSVGIGGITWLSSFIKKRHDFQLKMAQMHDDDEDQPK